MSATVVPIRQLPASLIARSVAEVATAIAEASTVAEAFAYYEALRPMSDDLCKLTTLALKRADELLREDEGAPRCRTSMMRFRASFSRRAI